MAGQAPQGCFRSVGLLDNQGEGVDRLPYLSERHVAALEAEPPKPSKGRPLGALRLVFADDEDDGEDILEV